MATKKVSVVIPTYNRAHLIVETIHSALSQTLTDLEVLVVDDGSTDDTREVIDGLDDDRVKYFRLDHTGNLSKLRNFGIRQASGAYIAFLDSDDLWLPDKLARDVELLDQHANVALSLCGFEVFDADGIRSYETYQNYGQTDGQADNKYCIEWIFQPLVDGRMMLYTSTVVFRVNVLEQIDGLYDDLVIGDHEFFVRLAHHGKAAIVRLPLVRIRRHDANWSLHPAGEGYVAVIHSIEHFYASGAISRELYLAKKKRYHFELAQERLAIGDTPGARRNFLTCLRYFPLYSAAWKAYLASFLR